MSWSIPELVILTGILLFSWQISAVAGFGSGVLFQLLFWSFSAFQMLHSDDFVTAIMIFVHSALLASIFLTYLQKKTIGHNLEFMLYGTVPGVLSVSLGLFLLEGIDNEVLIRLCGGMLIVIFVLSLISNYLLQRKQHSTNQETQAENVSDERHVNSAVIAIDVDDITQNESNDIKSQRINNENKTIIVDKFGVKFHFETTMDAPSSSTTTIQTDLNIIRFGNHKSRVLIAIVSLFSGIIGGLMGLSGIPWMIFTLVFDIPKSIMISLIPFFNCFAISMWILVFSLKSESNRSKLSDNMTALICAVIAPLFGLSFGRYVLSKHVNQQGFKRIVQFVMFGGGINLLLIDTDVQSYVSLFLVSIVFTAFVSLLSRSFIHSHK